MGTEVAKYDKAWAEQADEMARRNPVSAGNYISHRSGKFRIGEDMELPELCVIVVGDMRENSYYGSAYDPNADPAPPVCFAFAEDGNEKTMEPHPAMQADEYFEPQNDACGTCALNKYGTADKGKGKACRNVVRLCLIPAGAYFEKKGSRDLDLEMYVSNDDLEGSEEHIRTADSYMLKVPPTSIRNFSSYVNAMRSEYRRPAAGVITRIYTAPMDKGGHELRFEPIELVPDGLYPAVSERIAAERPGLIQPYTAPTNEEDGASAPRSRLRPR